MLNQGQGCIFNLAPFWRRNTPLLLPGLFAGILAVCAWWISCERANPDLWLQLLAAEGISEGRGYGFEEQGSWISIADRPPITRWPPGVSVLAATITMLGGDPLIFLTHLYPILLGASYLILFAALRKYVSLGTAAIGAFYALSFHSVIQSHRVLQSEPLALFLSLLLAKTCAESDSRFWTVLRIVMIGIILTMVRSAGAFVVTGALAGYVLGNYSTWVKRFVVLTALVGLTLLPIILFQSGDSSKVNPVFLFKEMIGNTFPAVELIGPHFYPDGRLLPIRAVIAEVLVILISFITLRKTKSDLGVVSLLIFFAYVCMLAYSSSRYEYSWWTLYRVTGFVLPFLAIAFTLILPKGRLWLALLLLISMGHLAQTLVAAEKQPGYREVHDTIEKESRRLGVDKLCVNSDSREILRLLWYSRRYYKELGVDIRYENCGNQELSVKDRRLMRNGEILAQF